MSTVHVSEPNNTSLMSSSRPQNTPPLQIPVKSPSGPEGQFSATSGPSDEGLASLYKSLWSPKSPMSSAELFDFAKVPLGDFERCLAFVESHQAIDFRASAEVLLWQTYKTFDRLAKRDYEDRHHQTVQDFANQCVQQYALLDYGADCGYENLRKYLHNLVLTSEWYRTDYLDRLMRLPPPDRLEYIRRPVPAHIEKLRMFCVLYDYMYEKIERQARHRTDETLLNRFQSRLGNVHAQLTRRMTVPPTEIGRAL